MGEGRKYGEREDSIGKGRKYAEREDSMGEGRKYGEGKEVCEKGMVMCIFVRKWWYGCIGR